jgi:hypothetical protein
VTVENSEISPALFPASFLMLMLSRSLLTMV